MNRLGACLLIPALLTLSTWAVGQELRGRTVQSVEVQGLSQVSDQLVKSKLEIKPGEAYNPQAVARDIRRLYDLGFFSHIEADAQPAGDTGISVTYVVQEKRTIDEIKIIGNSKVRTRQIRGAMSWHEGDAFIPDAYDEERDSILKLYETKGFPNATVDISAEEISPAHMRLTYAINEGKKARIKSINFEGNQVLSDRALRKLMKTRRSWWFLGGKYDEAVFEADLQKILDEYGNYGRLEAQVVDTAVQAEGKGLNITVKLSEGPEYHVETLETAGNYVFDNEEVGKLIKTKAGEVHNRGQVEEDASTIEQGYRDSGYVSARVTPQVTLDREKKTTHIVNRVAEGDLKYIEEVKISGNTVTKDEVIRRELMVKPGERFDGPAIRASQNRLDNTKYFDKIRLTLEDPDETDPFANLLVDVEEAKTGEFTFGGGYSTEEGIGGYTQLRLNNFDISNWPTFSGGGQQFNARISIGEVRNEYSIGFTDPELFGYPVMGGFDVFNESYEYHEGTDFTEKTTGAQLRFGKNLSPYVTARASLRYRDIDISDIPWFAAPELSRERGGSTTISTIWGINRNTLDLRFDPTKGSRHDLQMELAGLGGDNEFVKLEHDSSWYFPLNESRKWILSYRTREGWASEYGSSDFVPINDRFFVGGTTTVRGYDAQDIGPKVRRYWLWGDKEAIGGDARLVENLELKYKLTDKFRLYTFVDAGGAWRDASDFDFGDIKVGTGIGIGVDVPRLGPIRLDYGFPINPDGDQGSGRLHFTTTTRF